MVLTITQRITLEATIAVEEAAGGSKEEHLGDLAEEEGEHTE